MSNILKPYSSVRFQYYAQLFRKQVPRHKPSEHSYFSVQTDLPLVFDLKDFRMLVAYEMVRTTEVEICALPEDPELEGLRLEGMCLQGGYHLRTTIISRAQ